MPTQLSSIAQIVSCARQHWPDLVQSYQAIADGEHLILKSIGINNVSYAIRFHKNPTQHFDRLESEIFWVNALSRSGCRVSNFLHSKEGNFLLPLGNGFIDVSQWLDGENFSGNGRPIGRKKNEQVFYEMGESMASIHQCSDQWSPPEIFTRPLWHIEGLLGSNPVWGRFWENSGLTPPQQQLIAIARTEAYKDLTILAPDLDYGLIHADVIRANALVGNDGVSFVDFDDGGYGYRIYDFACLAVSIDSEVYSRHYINAFIQGYRALRPIEIKEDHMTLFSMLRTFAHLGWVMQLEPSQDQMVVQRACIRKAVKYASKYLALKKSGA